MVERGRGNANEGVLGLMPKKNKMPKVTSAAMREVHKLSLNGDHVHSLAAWFGAHGYPSLKAVCWAFRPEEHED